MKAVLKFKLPEERDEHHLAIHGGDYYLCLWDLDQNLRSQIKYSESWSDKQIEVFELVRKDLYEIMQIRTVSFDDVE